MLNIPSRLARSEREEDTLLHFPPPCNAHPKFYLSLPDSQHPRSNHHSAQGAIFSWLVYRCRLRVLFFSLTQKKNHLQNAPGIGFGMALSAVTRPRRHRYRPDPMHLMMTWAVISMPRQVKC